MARIPTAEIVENGRRKIVNADDPRVKGPAAGALTRADLDTLKRADVVDLLEAHGVTDHKGKKLPELRAILKQAIFLEV